MDTFSIVSQFSNGSQEDMVSAATVITYLKVTIWRSFHLVVSQIIMNTDINTENN